MNVSDESYRVGFINGGPKPQGPIANRDQRTSKSRAKQPPWVQFLMPIEIEPTYNLASFA